MYIPFTLLIFIAVISVAHTSNHQQFKHLLRSTFCQYRQAHGYYEYIRGEQGVVELQRTATSGNNSLGLLELTNGSVIVQLVFTQSDILNDCDVSTSRHHIHSLLKHVSSKRSEESFTSAPDCTLPGSSASDSSAEVRHRVMNLRSWIERCDDLHGRLLRLGEAESKPVMPETVKSVRIDRSSIETDSGERRRDRRGLMDLIYPGTKWCGKGNSSKDYYDLGEYSRTDSCCRKHDHCPYVIPGLSTAYNYFNYGILTMSSCDCDDTLRRCLQNASKKNEDHVADLIGRIYFNVIGMDCFHLVEEKICIESSFWGRCLKRKKGKQAIFGETAPYDPW